MKRLNANGIPALPVHDSLIVPREAYWPAMPALNLEARSTWGVDLLEPKVTPPLEDLPAPHRGRYKHLLR
jgi:hypothetical protein